MHGETWRDSGDHVGDVVDSGDDDGVAAAAEEGTKAGESDGP